VPLYGTGQCGKPLGGAANRVVFCAGVQGSSRKVNKAAVEYSGNHGVNRESTPLPAMMAATTTCIEEP
jgi:hypothetical protein